MIAFNRGVRPNIEAHSALRTERRIAHRPHPAGSVIRGDRPIGNMDLGRVVTMLGAIKADIQRSGAMVENEVLIIIAAPPHRIGDEIHSEVVAPIERLARETIRVMTIFHDVGDFNDALGVINHRGRTPPLVVVVVFVHEGNDQLFVGAAKGQFVAIIFLDNLA